VARRVLSLILGLTVVASALVGVTGFTAAPLAQAAGAGQYSAPAWLPMRHNGTSEVKVGCTYKSYGSQGGYNCNGYHGWWALDLLAAVGTPVYAAGAGQVVGVRTGNSGCSATSNYVLVNHNGSYSYYTHLNSVNVVNGAWVDQNSKLGTVGKTGLFADGCVAHLHFEKRSGTTQATAIDPGALKACHGVTLVSYPAVWGLSTWQGVPWGTKCAHSDGTGCTMAQPTHVVTRVGSNLYDWTSPTSMTLISNTASAGRWQVSGDRVALLDANGLWVRDGAGMFHMWSAPDVQEFKLS